ncbi:MAG: glucose-1-phosphate adenylyltransferase subunit GlgD [Clostridia bacterium]|nr:glucose-1-phosphate adenylyltransferase subunit GlgD [Clostridia bacterium]
MKAAGLIFSNVHDASIPELTKPRTMASIPFGGRYRLIDFALSNMVNSDITTVGLITHNNYQSLLDHIGTGKDWDLARRSGGIRILPPFITSATRGDDKLYKTRLEALIGVKDYVENCGADHVIISDCNMICNIDFSDALDNHIANNADVTIITKLVNTHELKFPLDKYIKIVDYNENGEIVDYVAYDKQQGELHINTNMMIIKRSYLLDLIDEADSRGYDSFSRDVIIKNLGKHRFFAFEYDGYFNYIDSMQKYFFCSMKMLDSQKRRLVFHVKNRPVYTKVRNSAPTRYTENAKVTNSIIADGCVIDGVVENSILFRGVRVGKGTVVKNSILMQNTYTGDDVYLNCVVTDKDVTIKDGKMLSGHETLPFFIGKGITV